MDNELDFLARVVPMNVLERDISGPSNLNRVQFGYGWVRKSYGFGFSVDDVIKRKKALEANDG